MLSSRTYDAKTMLSETLFANQVKICSEMFSGLIFTIWGIWKPRYHSIRLQEEQNRYHYGSQ